MKIFKATIIASTILMAGSLSAQARDLTVVSWGGNFQDAQRKIFFEPYAAETGKPVLDESWDGGYGVLQAKVKAGVPNWDVVEVEAEELALGCADGIYEKIDWEKLGGKDAYLAAAVSDCGVGNIVWSTGLSYDGEKLKEAPKTWADFWDTKKFPGKRGFRKGPKYALEFALMADGVPAKEVYDVLSGEGGVDRAFKKLDELKADIIWWDAGAQPLQLPHRAVSHSPLPAFIGGHGSAAGSVGCLILLMTSAACLAAAVTSSDSSCLRRSRLVRG